MNKGKIKPDWFVWCGRCYTHEHVDKYDAVNVGGRANLARSKGWRLTRAYGWVCSDCASRPPATPGEEGR